uniref:Uncharacterized protein LOC113785394 n=1 Tax=Cicer arietinum TaxID=3827 RepID=A0A3Q7YCK1_CICAR|nr:uncharacterized protein LOC113785394 [Cicer arietinum]
MRDEDEETRSSLFQQLASRHGNNQGKHKWKSEGNNQGEQSRETLSDKFWIGKMNSNGFGSNIMVLDGKNWARWSALMKSLFGAQEVSKIVQDGNEDLVRNPTDAFSYFFNHGYVKISCL